MEELTPEQLSKWNRGCDMLRDMFAQSRQSIEEGLSRGVDAKEFAAQYERAVAELETILMMTERVVRKSRTSAVRPRVPRLRLQPAAARRQDGAQHHAAQQRRREDPRGEPGVTRPACGEGCHERGGVTGFGSVR